MIGCRVVIRLIISYSLSFVVLVSLWWKERMVGWRILVVR
jgi:uncharacterized membrane protein